MSIYASDTSVSIEKSRGEIESTLQRYGASAFAYATNNNKAMIQFQADNRRIMFVLELPDPNHPDFTRFRGILHGRELSKQESYAKWEKAGRQKWRCLALVIKAKLEAVESGIATFEDEFMANIVMPDGKTVGTHMRPKIEAAYQSNKMPALTFGGME